MDEMRRRDARSLERQRLADAIAAQKQAESELAAVQQAQERLEIDLRTRLRPALGVARQQLVIAQADAPHRLIDTLVRGRVGDPLPAAEKAVEEAERDIEHARHSRELLDRELATRQRYVEEALREVEAAAKAAISADPKKQELVDEFFRTGKHLLRLAQAIRTLGIIVTGVDNQEIGLGLRLHEIAKPGYQGHVSNFVPDAEFGLALSDLRCDPDSQLPDPPLRPVVE